MRSLSNDLAEAAEILETSVDMGFEWTRESAANLAQSMRNFGKRAEQLEAHLRSAHVELVTLQTTGAAASLEDDMTLEGAVRLGVAAGVVIDLREVFMAELEFRGRPLHGFSLGQPDRSQNGAGDAA